MSRAPCPARSVLSAVLGTDACRCLWKGGPAVWKARWAGTRARVLVLLCLGFSVSGHRTSVLSPLTRTVCVISRRWTVSKIPSLCEPSELFREGFGKRPSDSLSCVSWVVVLFDDGGRKVYNSVHMLSPALGWVLKTEGPTRPHSCPQELPQTCIHSAVPECDFRTAPPHTHTHKQAAGMRTLRAAVLCCRPRGPRSTLKMSRFRGESFQALSDFGNRLCREQLMSHG